MQNVVRLSALTYECTQLTPSSPLRSTTTRHVSAPPLSTGISSLSGHVRCTMYRGIGVLLIGVDGDDRRARYGRPHGRTSGGLPMLGALRPYVSGVLGPRSRLLGVVLERDAQADPIVQDASVLDGEVLAHDLRHAQFAHAL